MAKPFLSTKLLSQLKDLDEANMPSSCRVLRSTAVITFGFTEYSEPDVISGPVPCRLTREARDPRDAQVFGREGDEPEATVALPLGTELRDLDTVEVTTDVFGEEQVQKFEVQGDPWVSDFATSLLVKVWREDERHGEK